MIVQGKVISGPITRGMALEIAGKIYRVDAISVNKNSVEYAETGTVAALRLQPSSQRDYKALKKKLKGKVVHFSDG